MTVRTLAAAHPAYRDDIGDLVTRRPVPGPGLAQIDPFLFLNHHGPQIYRAGNSGLPFGPHPHRGFETVTFILDGDLAHYDTGGHESVITAGGVQWMTAGSGLIHAELSPKRFMEQGGRLEILQLWVNLPARLKMVSPAYRGVQADHIPTIDLIAGRGELNLVAGRFGDAEGPIKSITGIFMSTVRLKEGAEVELPAPRGRSVLLYGVSGRIAISGQILEPWRLARMNDDGDRVAVAALSDAVLLYGHADPLGEPVAAHGPFVMNTREEILQAIRDYEAGLFNGDGKSLEVGP